MKKILLFLCSILLMLPISSQAQDGTNTVYDVIANSPEHNLLETVLGLAGLPETLQGDAPLTVFAPTDAAIGALPGEMTAALIADPMGSLRDLLLYHVIEGNVLTADLADGGFVRTLAGEEIFVTVDSDGVFINDAKVTVADIVASNGVVHVIDVVLMPAGPPSTKGTVVEVIQASPDHASLSGILTISGLNDDLSGMGPFTVFAPTDAAISALPEAVTAALLADPMGQLTQVLLYHVVPGIYPDGPLSTFQKLTTLHGQDITISTNEAGVFIDDAKIIVTDLLADNGIVHVLDAVLVPDDVDIDTGNTSTGANDGANPVNITFTVEMSKETVAPEGIFIAGSFNGWEDKALMDFNNGLWSTFISANPGDTIEYKFKNGPEGWEGDIEGDCSAGGFGNRQYIVTDETVSLPLVCFNSCLGCTEEQGAGTGSGETGGETGGETMDTIKVEVMVTVDVSKLGEELSAEGMFVAGTFNGWTNTAMTDNGDGTWSAILPTIAGDDLQYKFKNGPEGWEANDEGPCKVPESLGNRGITVPEVNVIMPTVCFNSCSACTVPITLVVDLSDVEVDPAGALVAGAFNGWTDGAMTDNGDGTWSATQELCPGEHVEFKFKNGPDGWESVAGACAVASGDNRLLVVPGEATTLSAVCLNSCIGCSEVEATFHVDMSGETLSEEGVRIAGSFNGWSDQLMTDNGDGTWSITIPVNKGEVLEYKFKNGSGGWEESVSGTCVAGDSEFGNRTVTVGEESVTVPLVCFNSCEACTAPMITFTVDMSEQEIDTAGVFMSGSFNGWGDAPMTDNGDGTYSVTLQLPSREPIEYKFRNGAEGWEEIAGGTCLAEGFSNNRGYTPGNSDATLSPACFGSCTGCGLVGVTVTVDLSQENVDPDGAYIAGSFNGWGDTPMTDVGNGLWTATIEAMPGDTIQYKFKNGLNGWENVEGDCIDANFGGNRVIFVSAEEVASAPACFNSCTECIDIPRPDPIGNTSLPIEMSCLNEDGTITIRFDYNYNCSLAPGNLSGLPEIGFHSGVNTWSTVIAWDDSTALTAVNDGNDVFSVTFDPVAYYGLASFDEITNIGMVFNQGPANTDEPWAAEGKDEGEGACADLFLYFDELRACSDVGTGGGELQSSAALISAGSCVNATDGTVTINFDLSQNCAEAGGSLAGMEAIGFHSGANMWSSVVEWDAATAMTAANNGIDVFSVTINPETYYGIPLADLENIFMVYNQGPANPGEPWGSEGKQQGDGACEDFRVYISELPACPVVTIDVQSMPLMFESSTIEYQLFGFGAPDGPIPAVIIDNPDASGENASGKVLSITKSENAQTWAGVAMPVEGGFDFSGSNVLEMNVWSPRAGVPFLLKIEDTNSPPDANGNPSVIAEVQVSTTVANAWEVLAFDMSQFGAFDATNGYNQVVVFPDFGNVGTGETFFVDGIRNTNTTSTVDIIQLNAFKVSPNPFQHSTLISWDNPSNASYQVKLLSVTGQTLRAFQDVTGSTFTLNRTGLESGLYFLNFRDEQGGTGTLKVLVK